MSTTEELKRSMYGKLAAWKIYATTTESFEETLETYLEALSQDRDDLERRLAQMTEERDGIQLRLHAVDHAYNEQQRSPALEEVLKHNKALIEIVRNLHQYIRTLYTSRKARKQLPATMAQRSGENASGDEPKRSAGHSEVGCQHKSDSMTGKDIFKGDNAKLVSCIEALLALDEKGALSPHGIGGHARTLLCASAARLKTAGAHLEMADDDFSVLSLEAGQKMDDLQKQLDALELSRRSWMDEAKSLEAMLRKLEAPVCEFHQSADECVAYSWESPCSLPVNPVADHGSLLESLAKQIYQSWESLPGFHPWVEGGNSLKQQEARQIASRTFELALANQVGGE